MTTKHTEDPAFNAGLEKAALPYNGTSGRGGSAASREAKSREDASGETTRRQRQVLAELDKAGPQGLNTAQLGVRLNLHHGQSSGALSSLHKVGLVYRLADTKRAGQSVYVHPNHLGGRAAAQHGGKVSADAATAESGVLTLTEREETLIGNIRGWESRDKDSNPILRLNRAHVATLLGLVDRATAKRG